MLYGAGRVKSEQDLFDSIFRTVRRIIRIEKTKRFVIFPDGNTAQIVEHVLQSQFGVSSLQHFKSVQKLSEYLVQSKDNSIVVLLADYELSKYDELRYKVKLIKTNPVVDLFPDKPLLVNDARLIAFEMASREIFRKNIEGDVAEVGVYRGYTASYLNQFFFDRKLHLFDTFDGFPEIDLELENEKHYSAFLPGSFADTSIETVLKQMIHPENCVFHKGYFPDTAQSVEKIHFCMVHLDADLYSPIYSGLTFFYPRLAKGGYIFVHDITGSTCIGAKSAIDQFCEEKQLSYVLMPDSVESGTAVIAKGN